MIDPEATFARLGVDVGRPGFYDDPAFMAEEARNPALLEYYAHFVTTRRHDEAYLARAKKVISFASSFMQEQVERDGRLGACGDLSTVFSRMLDRLGVWNYAIKGALTLEFPRDSGLAPVFFAPIVISSNPAVVGHAWVCAPPYKVVDLTIAQQPYSKNHRDYLPKLVLAEEAAEARFDAKDVFDPEAAAVFAAQYGRRPGRKGIEAMAPGLPQRAQQLGIYRVELPRASATYTCCGVTALDVSLEEAKNLTLTGRAPIDVFRVPPVNALEAHWRRGRTWARVDPCTIAVDLRSGSTSQVPETCRGRFRRIGLAGRARTTRTLARAMCAELAWARGRRDADRSALSGPSRRSRSSGSTRRSSRR